MYSLWLVAGLTLAQPAPADGGAAPSPKAQLQRVRALERQIASLAAAAACQKTEQCVAEPVGAKPCGGPERFLAVSLQNPKLPELRAALAAHAAARKAYVAQVGELGECTAVPTPRAVCEAKVCRLEERAPQPTDAPF